MEGPVGKKDEKRHLRFLRANSRDLDNIPGTQEHVMLPQRHQDRLHNLFEQIETEFGSMYAENVELRKNIAVLHEKLNNFDSTHPVSEKSEPTNNSTETHKSIKGKSGSIQLSQRLKTTYKSGTSKLVSSFKPSAGVVCRFIQEFQGHKDGIWDVASSQLNTDVIGSASADQKAKLWNVTTGHCIATYHGHVGSVNCIRFHPDRYIALTVSGDSTAHIWTYEAPRLSSCDEDSAEHEDSDDNGNAENHGYRAPLTRSHCHTSPVVCCDWLMDGLHFVTASWDRTACLVDSTTSQVVQTLSGHDSPLTHVSAHSKHKMIVTSSRDATFRVCDFRVPTVHTVIVGQGHSQPVTSAVFTNDDKVVSSSDDRTIKIWDLKSMRTPLASIRFDSPVNRINASRKGVIIIPHDNRQVRLYDTSGNRLARLPRNDRSSHRRVVTAATWIESSTPSVVTCGWDKLIINWSVEFPPSLMSLK